MKVKQTIIKFSPSISPDVVGYKLYIAPVPDAVTYESQSFDLGNQAELDLATLDGMTTTDGVYNLGVTAVDDAGNESSMLTTNDVPLDFSAPDAPSALEIIRQ
jgi:hypothetical protein